MGDIQRFLFEPKVVLICGCYTARFKPQNSDALLLVGSYVDLMVIQSPEVRTIPCTKLSTFS